MILRQPLELAVDQIHGREAERHIDPERHRPVQVVGDIAADHRSGHAGGNPDGADIGLIFAAFAWRDGVAHGRLHQRHDSAAAVLLQPAHQDQGDHVRRQRAGDRAHHEQA